jgi:hypothetical protein
MVRMLTTSVFVLVGAMAMVGAQAPAGQAPAERPAVQQPAQPPSQERPAQASEPQRSAQPSEKTDADVTVAGCLKPGTATGSWMLENAEMASAAPVGGKPGEAAKGTTGAASVKKTYSLLIKAADDLKGHANHKIEVTGTISQAGGTPPAAAAAASASAQQFNVKSFKMVSATCP